MPETKYYIFARGQIDNGPFRIVHYEKGRDPALPTPPTQFEHYALSESQHTEAERELKRRGFQVVTVVHDGSHLSVEQIVESELVPFEEKLAEVLQRSGLHDHNYRTTTPRPRPPLDFVITTSSNG